MLKNIDLNKLLTFSVVFRTQSLLRGSQELRVTPSAVSQAIQALEASLGLMLFVRSGKKYIPTPAGVTIYSGFHDVLENLQSKIAEARGNQNQMVGRLRIGCPPQFGAKVLTPILVDFQRRYPGSSIVVSFAGTKQLVGQIATNQFDLSICDEHPDEKNFPQISHIPIYEEELWMVCSKKYFREKVRGKITLSSLKTFDHIPYHEGKEAIYKWYRHHYRSEFRGRATLFLDNVNAVLEAIGKDAGLSVVPAYMVREEIKAGKMVMIASGKSALKNKMAVLQLLDKPQSRLELVFLKFLRSALA